MFMSKIDWNDKRFSRWRICNLRKLNKRQKDGFLKDDEKVDITPVTEEEQIELWKKYECKVELFNGNVCYGVEKSWPRKYFKTAHYNDLSRRNKKIIKRTMERDGYALYKKYVDLERMRRHCQRHNNRVLAPFWELRVMKNRFERIKRLRDEKSPKSPITRSMDKPKISLRSKNRHQNENIKIPNKKSPVSMPKRKNVTIKKEIMTPIRSKSVEESMSSQGSMLTVINTGKSHEHLIITARTDSDTSDDSMPRLVIEEESNSDSLIMFNDSYSESSIATSVASYVEISDSNPQLVMNTPNMLNISAIDIAAIKRMRAEYSRVTRFHCSQNTTESDMDISQLNIQDNIPSSTQTD